MSSKPHTGVGTVSAQIAGLPALPMAELWALWDQHFPRRPKHINRSFLESRLAYRIQEMAYGAVPVGTGERIRDKIAASKRKGMWMGGPLPLADLLPGTIGAELQELEAETV